MFLGQFDGAIPNAPEFRDSFVEFMNKAFETGELLRNPYIGIHEDHILLAYTENPSLYKDENANKALKICEAWANGRNVEWMVFPPTRTMNDPLAQRGYIGCSLIDN